MRFENIDKDNFLLIVAPVSGVITDITSTQPGDKVQANNTIATIVSRSNLTVELGLEPEDAAKLAPGAAVKLRNTFGGDEIEGKLRSIGASVDPMTHLVKALCDVPAAMAAKIALNKPFAWDWKKTLPAVS